MSTTLPIAPPTACPCCGATRVPGAAQCPRCGLLLTHPLVVTLATGLDMAARLRHEVAADPGLHPRPAAQPGDSPVGRPAAPGRQAPGVATTHPVPAMPAGRPSARPTRVAGTGSAQPPARPAAAAVPATPGGRPIAATGAVQPGGPAPLGTPSDAAIHGGSVPLRPGVPGAPALLGAPATSGPASGAADRAAGPAAPDAGRHPTGARGLLRGRSVGWVLLAVGTLCLVAAAFAFVVVTWSWMPWPARAALLVLLAAGAVAATDRVATRGLRATAEAGAVVASALGLAAWGAAERELLRPLHVTWNGHVIVGTVVLAAVGLALDTARRARGHALVAPDVVGGLGVAAAGLVGAATLTGPAGLPAAALLTVAAVPLAAARTSAPLVTRRRLTRGAAAASCAGAARLAAEALHAAVAHAGSRDVLVLAWPAVLLAAVAAMVWRLGAARRAAPVVGGLALAVWVGAAVSTVPGAPRGARATVGLLAALALLATGLRLPRRRAALVALVPSALAAAAWSVPVLVDGGLLAAARYEDVLAERTPEHGDAVAGGLLLLAAAGLAAVVGVSRRGTSGTRSPRAASAGTAAVALALAAAAAALPTPAALLGAAAVGAGLLVVLARRADRWVGLAAAGVIGVVAALTVRGDLVGGLALPVAALLALAAGLSLRAQPIAPTVNGTPRVTEAACPVEPGAPGVVPSTAPAGAVPPLLAPLGAASERGAWLLAAAALVDAAVAWCVRVAPAGRVALALGVVALVAAAWSTIRDARPDRGVLETWFAGTWMLAAPMSPGSTELTAVLALAAAGYGVIALRRADRSRLRWVGAVLALLGWYVQLAAHEVNAPEPYSLPAAALLALAGWRALATRPQRTSWSALTPALLAGIAPTAARAWHDPASARTAVLVLAAAALVAVSVRWRLAAPFVAGVGVLAAIAAKTLAPMSGTLPAWAPLAVAGVVLVALGATWEARLEDLRRARAFVASMR